MLLVMGPKFRSDGMLVCCDVSWISDYPEEHEVLIARGYQKIPQLDDVSDKWNAKVEDNGNIQIIYIEPTNFKR